MLAATFSEKPSAGPFRNWQCLPCWCLGGLSIVFRWSLVSCGTFGGATVGCFGGVSTVSWHRSGGFLGVLKEWYFLD